MAAVTRHALCRTVEDAQQRTHRERNPSAHPWVHLLPSPDAIPTWRRLPPLATADQDAAARTIEDALSQRDCLPDTETSPPSSTMSARALKPYTVSPVARITGKISSTGGRLAGSR